MLLSTQTRRPLRLLQHLRSPYRTLATPTSAKLPQTYIEKVVQKHTVDLAPGKTVHAGDFIMMQPAHCMTHDNTGPVISKFKQIGASRFHSDRQPVFTLDHDVQNKSAANLNKYAKIEAFARENGIDFYPAGRGIGHQIMIEEGYAFPQSMTVASDSHSNMYGGVGCVGTPIVRTDAAAIWATGRTWWQIPEQVKVELKGSLAPGVTGKDVIVALCGTFNQDQVLNSAIEFVGEAIQGLSIDERLAIANMTTEWGALAGVFPVDDALLKWYDNLINKLDASNMSPSLPKPSESHPRLNRNRLNDLIDNRVLPDSNAKYSKHLVLDLSTLVPHVSGPNSVKVSTSLPDLAKQNIAIQKAYLVSCTNSRASDIKAAADVVRGKSVAPGVEFYIAAASSLVQKQAEESGDWGALVAAGAKTLPAGCGPCIGLGTGLLEEGETGISATNRNFKGRMGHPKALAYLASPAVVAASAVAGKICGPEEVNQRYLENAPSLVSTIEVSKQNEESTSSATTELEPSASTSSVLPSFPTTFTGKVIFVPQDNLNTDGIYPGKYTYQDDITSTQQAEVVMSNYDTSFASAVAAMRGTPPLGPESPVSASGPILACGYNFGTGSSREQAATALRYSGVPLVISASFGDIFKRNAINNSLICIECPEFINDLTNQFAKDGQRGQGGKQGELSVQTEYQVTIHSASGKIEVALPDGTTRTYQSSPIGQSVQEVSVAGGLEKWVQERL